MVDPRCGETALPSDPFVLFSNAAMPDFADRFRAACRDAGFSHHVIGHADEVSGLLAYALAGRAVTLMAEQVGTLRYPDIAFLHLRDPSLHLSTTVVAMHRHRPDPAVQRLITLLADIGPPPAAASRPGPRS
jgi:DNA-binding transcriptional LysR family regulator